MRIFFDKSYKFESSPTIPVEIGIEVRFDERFGIVQCTTNLGVFRYCHTKVVIKNLVCAVEYNIHTKVVIKNLVCTVEYKIQILTSLRKFASKIEVKNWVDMSGCRVHYK